MLHGSPVYSDRFHSAASELVVDCVVDVEHCLDKGGVRCSGSDTARDDASSDGRVVGDTDESVRFEELAVVRKRIQGMVHYRGNGTKLLLVEVNVASIVVSTVDATGPSFEAHLVNEPVQVVEVTSETVTDTGDSHLKVLGTSIDCADSSYTGRSRVKALDKCTCNSACILHGLPVVVQHDRDDSMQGIMGDELPIEPGSILFFEALLPEGLVLVVHLGKMMVTAHSEHVGDGADHVGEILTESFASACTESDTKEGSVGVCVLELGILQLSDLLCLVIPDIVVCRSKGR